MMRDRADLNLVETDITYGSGGFLRAIAQSYNKQDVARFRSHCIPEARQEGEETPARADAGIGGPNADATPSVLGEREALSIAAPEASQAEACSFDTILTGPAFHLLTVDTLHLNLEIHPGMIRPGHGLIIEQAKGKRRNRVLWEDTDGARIEGARAYWPPKDEGKSNGVYVQVSPMRHGYIGRDSVCCWVQITMPSIVGRGDNA